jgi:hypothetical protein
MYKSKDRKTLVLFPELFPFGGKLNEDNRWLRIAELIPWEELEDEYRKYFSDVGRPAKDAHLVIGLLLLKHMTGLSDEGLVEEVSENPYMQAFCGFTEFVTDEALDPSTLSKLREKLGLEFFKQLERKTYKVLIERKIIRAKGMLVDATVFSEEIRYPNDVGLLNTVREWLVRTIKRMGKVVGKKPRTYSRRARQEYLRFSKRKNKTKKAIAKAKKAMLQYVRRNLKQMKEIVRSARRKGLEVKGKIISRLRVAERIFSQQWEMYRRKVNRIAERIVSFHRPYVRPIKRGKQGKEVEFGGKGALSQVDGFLFLDYFAHEAYAEQNVTVRHLEAYAERFGKLPPSFTADQKYGTRENRELMGELEIRESFKPLGRKAKDVWRNDRWFRNKQKERNRIEGSLGHGKEHYGLDRVRYSVKDGSEIWVRAGILAMNLRTAAKRA